MTDHDLTPIQTIISQSAPKSRTNLLPVLHAAQEVYGYIPEDVAAEIARGLGVPLSEVFGVIDFYTLFYSHPVEKTVVHVCNDPACSMAGADSVLKVISRELSYYDDQRRRPSITLDVAPCLGLCDHAPALLVKGQAISAKDQFTVEDLFVTPAARLKTIIAGDLHLLTKNCGKGQTTSSEEYITGGGYNALKQSLQSNPANLIELVKNAGLVGRGGAAFPTGVKWEAAARETETEKYVICNGDEAEPGTFKDRILMEDDPHQIIEGLILAGYAIGAQKGYFYIRGEYLNAYNQVQYAIQEAIELGFLGDNILGSNFSFDIELRKGAGAYICGEETALFESIEGKRGFPRVKPPFPTQHGLFGKPTVINNVETLANVPLIVNMGVELYREMGTKSSPGPKLFCLSGDVNRPGLYEVPFGVSLRYLIEELAGGTRDDIPFQAALIGGAAGALASSNQLDTKLTFEDLRAAGLPLGSGVITVFNSNRNLKEVLLKLATFFAEESCGKCFPCQIGTQRQVEILERIHADQAERLDIARLNDLIATMTDASLCGLGQTAGSAVRSAIVNWPELFSPPTVELIEKRRS